MALNKNSYWEAILRAEPLEFSLGPVSQRIVESFRTADIKLIIVNVAAYDYTKSPLRCVPHNLRPPIGLFSLQAAVVHAGHDFGHVHVVDMERERLAPADLAALVS